MGGKEQRFLRSCTPLLRTLDMRKEAVTLAGFLLINRIEERHMEFKKKRLTGLICGILGGVLAEAGAAEALSESVNVVEQWVETEKRISEVEADWAFNRATMQNLIELYSEEIGNLDQVIEEAQADVSAAERERAELRGRDEALKEVESGVLLLLEEAEVSLKRLEPLLPKPLAEELSPLFRGLPEDVKNSRLSIGQRIQPVVAILTQIQKFNQVVTVVEGFREFEAGKTVQTETVYFGLGAAYYVDQANSHAGVGELGPEGWEWRDDRALVGPVRTFVNIYRGLEQATYVEVPLSVR